MAPSSVLVAAQLRQMIYYHLDNGLEDNALFLAGRLHALDARSLDAIHLLAVCHARLGQHKAAYQVTKMHALRGSHVGCSHAFAQACLVLDKASEGVAALDRTKHMWSTRTSLGLTRSDSHGKRFVPDASASWCLQGKLCRKNLEEKRAIDSFIEALRLNPFMWDAFEGLSNSNVPIKPTSIFKGSPELLAFLSGSDSHRRVADEHHTGKAPTQITSSAAPTAAPSATPTADPFSAKADDYNPGLGRNNAVSKMNIGASAAVTSSWDTPPSLQSTDNLIGASTAGTALHAPGFEPPAAPLRKTRSVHMPGGESVSNAALSGLSLGGPSKARSKAPSEASEDSDPRKPSIPTSHFHQKRTISGSISQTHAQIPEFYHLGHAPQRRSTRLSKKDQETAIPQPSMASRDPRELKKARATGTRGRAANSSTVGRVVSGNRKPLDPSELSLKPPSRSTSANSENGIQTKSTDAVSERDSMNNLLELFSRLALGYYSLTKYQCSQALTHFSSLPAAQRDTPWVLVQTGKAYYEQTLYNEAERAFARVRKIDPTRWQDMEVYSTVLWHLKLDTELAHLSHELTDLERNTPQTWVTIGNSFALSRDHDQALKCFRRATQLDAKFSYAWTLQGHEHFENEEYDKAARAFRQAISIDRRQYNSWYGLGKCYDKQGRTEQAEEHFKIASQINPHNAVIVVGIGMVLEKQRKHQQALGFYDRAIELAPQAKLAHFRKARMLTQMRHFDAALECLLLLKDLVPDEPNVHFMLGRVYKRLRDRSSALRHYTTAMNLDPKAAGLVKEAMEELDDDDDDDLMDEDDGGY